MLVKVYYTTHQVVVTAAFYQGEEELSASAVEFLNVTKEMEGGVETISANDITIQG